MLQKKLHKVCHVISVEPFVLGLRCLHQNVQQRLLLTDPEKIFVQLINIFVNWPEVAAH